MINGLQDGPFTLITDDYRNRYKNYTLQAVSLAQQAISATDWSGTTSYVGQAHGQFEGLISTIYKDISDKIQSLVG